MSISYRHPRAIEAFTNTTTGSSSYQNLCDRACCTSGLYYCMLQRKCVRGVSSALKTLSDIVTSQASGHGDAY